jgi:hypothetical protein
MVCHSQCLLEAKFPVSSIATTLIDDNPLNRKLMKHDFGSILGSHSSGPQQNDFNSPENYLEAQ